MAIFHVNEVTVGTADMNELVTAAGSGALFQFYDGAIPADASVAPVGTLLATLTVSGALGTVTTGVSGGVPSYLTCNDPATANGVATGTPTFLRVATSAGVGVFDIDVSASGGGASFILTPDTITEGAPVAVTGLTVTHA